jgi:hypothetical protein
MVSKKKDMATKKAYDAAKKYWEDIINQQIDVVKEIVEDGSYKESKEKSQMLAQTAIAIEHMEKIPKLIDSLKNEKK